MKRSGKFYRKNEKEVMETLGLKATYNSGSGWIEKEDGQNDYLICQLKSTDAQSIKINQKDIRILEYNASVEKKIPIFAIQFLNTGEVWLMSKPEDYISVSEFLETGKTQRPENDIIVINETKKRKTKIIKSSGNAREEFKKEQEKRYDKTKSAK